MMTLMIIASVTIIIIISIIRINTSNINNNNNISIVIKQMGIPEEPYRNPIGSMQYAYNINKTQDWRTMTTQDRTDQQRRTHMKPIATHRKFIRGP
jgi:hypothetical protein